MGEIFRRFSVKGGGGWGVPPFPGSTVLFSVLNVDTVYTVFTNYTVDSVATVATVFIVYTIFKLLYTA